MAGCDGSGETVLIRSTRLVVGVALIGTASISAVLHPDRSEEKEAERIRSTGPTNLPAILVAAAIGAVMELERRLAGVARTAQGGFRTALEAVELTPLRWVIEAVVARVDGWSGRGRAEGDASVERVAAAWETVLGDVVTLVLRHVDVDQVLERVDLDAVAARIDIGALVDGVDLNRIAERLDVEAIVRRLDLGGIARDVLAEIEVDDIIRESSGSLTVQTVDALRARGAEADRRVARFVDRLLQRGQDRDVRIDGGSGDGEVGAEGGAA